MSNPKILLLSLAGFRYDYLDIAESRNIDISAFDKIGKIGVYIRQIQSVFPTMDYPTQFSIANGLHPESHGVVANEFFDPILNISFDVNERRSDSQIYDVGSEPIWVTNQMHNYTSGVINWIGSEAKIKGQLPTRVEPRGFTSKSFIEHIDNLIDWFDKDNITLGLMHYDQPLKSGEAYGPGSDEVLKEIKEKSLYEELKENDNVNVYFKNEIPAHLFYNSSVRIGFIVSIADPGFVTNDIDPIGSLFHYKGYSGYDPSNLEMSTFLMATGPHITQKKNVQHSFKLVDIYLLEPAPNNGSEERVRPLLRCVSLFKIIQLSIINSKVTVYSFT
ncbi:unnamed protein product [Schistosoma spindalis]|nr:unnamed protein product [Schistosoma spindale]